jgi:iron complex outermembrane recepter protein
MRIRTLTTAIGLSILSLSATSHADAAARKQTYINAQQLETALRTFADQRDLHLVFLKEDMQGLLTHGAAGDLTAQEALMQLLEGTGLTHFYVDDSTISIVPRTLPSTVASSLQNVPIAYRSAEQPRESFERYAAAGAEQSQSSTRSDTGSSAKQGAASAPTSNPERVELEIVTVTATRIERNGFQAPTPTTIVTAADLEKDGALDIAEYLNELPAFFPTATPSSTTLSPTNKGGNFVDLRGLGPQRTLVLVNSRRHVPTLADGAVDLNAVPSAAIKSIEVVTGGASAAWGSDAVAGVVNILYDTQLQGIRSDVQYGASEHGDNEGYRVSIAAGDRVLDDRGHFMIAGEFHRNFGIAQHSDRDWASHRWQRIANPLDTGPGDGQPAVVTRDNVSLLIASDGGRILGPGPVAGQEFGPGGTLQPVDFGSVLSSPYMIGGSGPNMVDDLALSAPYSRRTVLSTFQYDIAEDLRFFFEGSYNESESKSDFVPPFTFGVRLNADNAFMPEQLRTTLEDEGIPAIVIGRTNTDLGMIGADRRTNTQRAVFGLEGTVFEDWSWNAYYQYGRTTFHNEQPNNRILANFALAVDAVRDPDTGEIVCRAALDLASLPAGLRPAASACVPLNLFGYGSPSAEAIDYVTGTSVRDQVVRQEVAAAQITGDLAQLWAGPLSVAFGAEFRRESVDSRADAVSEADGFMITNPKSLRGSFDVREVFGELVLPVLSEVPLAKSLELNAAARWTDYSTIGNVVTSKLGLVWEPNDSLLLRAATSRDIRAPNINELFTTRVLSFFSPADPCNANSQAGDTTIAANCRTAGLPADFQSTVSIVPIVSGGNPSLHEEEAHVRTAGIVVTPSFIPGLRASFDWYDLKIEGAIDALPPELLVDQCYATAGYPSVACSAVHRGEDGQLAQVDGALLNIASMRARGVDSEIEYRMPSFAGGDIRLRLITSYVMEKSFSADGITNIDRAGEVGMDQGGIPEWRGTFGVDYNRERIGLRSQVRYVGEGKLDVTLTDEDIDRNDIPAQWYLDLSASYRWPLGGASVELFGGVNNVLDNDPPIAPIDFIVARQTNTGLYDIIGRYLYTGMRMRF